jgi:hypothetical protein
MQPALNLLRASWTLVMSGTAQLFEALDPAAERDDVIQPAGCAGETPVPSRAVSFL